MIKKFSIALLMICIFAGSYFYFLHIEKVQSREEFEYFINNHPYQKLLKTSEEEENEGENDQEHETDRPDLALMQDFLRTMDPLKKRPTPEILWNENVSTASGRQKKINSTARTLATSLASGTQWVEHGPNNVGGRTRAIMFDPNDAAAKKVWAGGVAGGLWFNNDITSSNSPWTKVDDLWDNLAITCITSDPINPTIFYVGTGEYWAGDYVVGAGIWKSIDKGATWNKQPLASTTSFLFVNDIAVRNEAGASVVYATVSGGFIRDGLTANSNGLYRSSDGGLNWTQVLPASVSNVSPGDIEIGKDNKIYVGAEGKFSGDKSVIYSSSTGLPNSWTSLTTTFEGRIELACAPSNNSIVYAAIADNGKIAGLYKSTDNGNTFNGINKPVDADLGIPTTDFSRGQANYDLIMAVDPSDANKVFIGTIDLFQSSDAGTTWKQISKWSNNPNLNTLTCSLVHADQHSIVFRPGFTNKMAVTNDGGIYYSDDITNAITTQVFQSRNQNYNVTQFYTGAIHPDKTTGTNNMLAGAQDNGTQRFTLPGLGSTSQVYGGDGTICFIDQQNAAFQIAAGVYNDVSLSTDGGSTFGTQLIDDNKNGNFINQGDYDSNIKVLFTSRSKTAVYRVKNVTTTHNVDSVKVNLGSMATALRISPYTTTASNLYVGTQAGRLFKVINADATPTITEITGSSFPNGTVSSIAFGANENQILVTFFNYGVINIWETRNGGSTWISREGNLPNMPVRWAEYHPQNFDQLYIATELGVWSTDNVNVTSPTWSSTNGGLANVRTDMLRIRKSDNTIMAATHGRGVFTALVPSSLDQAITFKTVTSKTFGDPSFKIWAQSSSGLPVTFTSTNAAVATVIDSTVTIVGGGVTTLVAAQSGNVVYKPAASVNQSLTVNKASQTITFGTLIEKDVDDPAFTIAATSTSALPVSFSSSVPTVATISGNAVTIIGPGTTIIKATQAGNGNYLAAVDAPQTLNVVTRIIQLTGTLDFGDVFLGEDDQKTFTITSIGTGSVTASKITYPAGYTGSSKVSSNSVDVTVTFTPVDVIDYTGTITVESDKTSGVNTIAVKGKGVKITALADPHLTKEFDVYPNPAKDVIYIKVNTPLYIVEVIDSRGRISKEPVTKVDNNTSQVELSKFAAGNYFLKIPTTAGHVMKQIVIQD